MANTITGQGLGYYVHYHGENYRKYGIVPKNSNKANVSAEQAVNETHKKLMNIVQQSKQKSQGANLKELESFLNSLGIQDYDKAIKLLEKDADIDLAAIIRDVETEIQKEYPNFVFDFEGLSLDSFAGKVTNL